MIDKLKDFDAEKEIEKVTDWIRDWFVKNGPTANAVIGISGGKDSLSLLYALNSLKRFYPSHLI